MDIVGSRLHVMRDAWIEQQSSAYDWYLEQVCESPIEKVLLSYMMVDGWRRLTPNETDSFAHQYKAFFAGQNATGRALINNHVPGYLIPQLTIFCLKKKYRADLAILCENGKIVVELDGHDFHERTKEQAKKDKSRDRSMALQKWSVMRFTGSEIANEPVSCMNQVHEMIELLS